MKESKSLGAETSTSPESISGLHGHTPAPWLVVGHGTNIAGLGGYPVAVVSTGTIKGAYEQDRIDANARLISCAPDMLEMLDAIEQEITDLERRLPDGPRFACLDELRRVIAKATGK